MRRFTPLENIISFGIGLLIATPICVTAVASRVQREMIDIAFNREPEIRYITQVKEVPVEVEKTVIVHDTVYLVMDDFEYDTKLSEEEIKMIACVEHYEARNQDDVGKRLVVDTVLNRMRSGKFPDTVEGVLKQNSEGVYQYTVVGMGVLSSSKLYYTDEELQIVYEELANQLDEDVIFFQRSSYSNCGEPLYQHGDHYFSKLKEA